MPTLLPGALYFWCRISNPERLVLDNGSVGIKRFHIISILANGNGGNLVFTYLVNTTREIRRTQEIVMILLRYGFGDLMRRLELAGPLMFAARLIRRDVHESFVEMTPPERAVRALEEMGPTFVKLGQILATRVDVFPPDWISAFERLQDEVPVQPFSALEARVSDALGKPWPEIFREIDPEPLGSASMAQVHRGVLRSGEVVVLKIRKPGISRKISDDLRLLKHLARILQNQSEEFYRYRPIEFVREFERSIKRELDFTIEAKHAEQIAQNLRGLKFLKIPKIFWAHTSAALSVQEYVAGIPAKDVTQIRAAGMDPAVIARRGGRIAWHMMLIDGFFHADPHPGNFLILPNHRICMLDFGMVGRLTPERRRQLAELTRYMVTQNPERVAQILVAWSGRSPENMEALISDTQDYQERYVGLSLSEINFNQSILDAMTIMRDHDLSVPADIALFSKACLTLEGFGRLMNPDFNMMTEAQQLISDMLFINYSPKRVIKRFVKQSRDLVDRSVGLLSGRISWAPREKSLLTYGDRQFLERLHRRFLRSGLRKIQTIMVSAALLSSAVISTKTTGAQIMGLHWLGFLGLAFTGMSLSLLSVMVWWEHRSRE